MKHCLKQRVKNKRKNTVLITVTDDWYPNLPDNKVTVFFDPEYSRISIWGDDDFGMERYGCSEQDFLNLKQLKSINQEYCKQMGFIPA